MIKDTIEAIRQFPKKIISNLPLILFGLFIFWTSKLLFGNHAGAVSVVFMLSAKHLFKTVFTWRNYIKVALMQCLSVVLGILALTHVAAAAGITLLYSFILFYFFADDFFEHNYYYFGLSFFLVQICVPSVSLLPVYIYALLYCGVLCGAFLFLMFRFTKTKPFNRQITLAAKSTASQLNILIHKATDKKTDFPVYACTEQYCLSNYEDLLAQGGLLDEKKKRNFAALLYFEALEKLIYEARNIDFSEQDLEYFKRLQYILANSKNQKRMAMEISHFLESSRLTDDNANEVWDNTLSMIAALLKNNAKPLMLNRFLPALKFKCALLQKRIGFNNLLFLSAAKKAIVITVTNTIACALAFLPIESTYWLPLMVYSLFILHSRITFKFLIPRFLATLVGIIGYGAFLNVLPLDLKLVFSCLISFFALACFDHPLVTAIFASELTLVSAVINTNSGLSIMLACLFATFGFVLAFLLTRFLLPLQVGKYCVCWVNDLLPYQTAVLDYIETADPTSQNNYVLELLFRQYMLITQLEAQRMYTMEYDQRYFTAFYEYNETFLEKGVEAFTAMYPKQRFANWIAYSRKQLSRML